MSLDRETVYQVLVSLAVVGLFIGAAVVVTETFSVNGNISPTGGFALVGVIVMFILVMAGAGLWLERTDFDGNAS